MIGALSLYEGWGRVSTIMLFTAAALALFRMGGVITGTALPKAIIGFQLCNPYLSLHRRIVGVDAQSLTGILQSLARPNLAAARTLFTIAELLAMARG